MLPRIVRKTARRLPGARRVQDMALTRHSATLSSLAPFAPNSAGPTPLRAALAMQSASNFFSFLDVYRQCFLAPVDINPIEEFAARGGRRRETELSELFKRHGSDKSSSHNYHLAYARILSDVAPVQHLLEIGLGTNNEDVISNMSSSGRPGASLRAFRDFLPEARIWGADIDSRILFEEDRIVTYFVDQTDLESVNHLAAAIPTQDVIIDDGLHSPDANLATLLLARKKLRHGGWVVIEDIGPEALPIWTMISDFLRDDFASEIVEARHSLMWLGKLRESAGEG